MPPEPRLVIGRVVSLEGGRPQIRVFEGGAKPTSGDRIAALIVSARNWKRTRAEHGDQSPEVTVALQLLVTAAEAID
jgi:hypothetical protein